MSFSFPVQRTATAPPLPPLSLCAAIAQVHPRRPRSTPNLQWRPQGLTPPLPQIVILIHQASAAHAPFSPPPAAIILATATTASGSFPYPTLVAAAPNRGITTSHHCRNTAATCCH